MGIRIFRRLPQRHSFAFCWSNPCGLSPIAAFLASARIAGEVPTASPGTRRAGPPSRSRPQSGWRFRCGAARRRHGGLSGPGEPPSRPIHGGGKLVRPAPDEASARSGGRRRGWPGSSVSAAQSAARHLWGKVRCRVGEGTTCSASVQSATPYLVVRRLRIDTPCRATRQLFYLWSIAPQGVDRFSISLDSRGLTRDVYPQCLWTVGELNDRGVIHHVGV